MTEEPGAGETGTQWCGGHDGLGAELRAVVLVALDRLGPALDRLRTGTGAPATGVCASCPVCAIIAALRGERPELAVRLAEQAAGVVAVLRAALEESGPTPAGSRPAPSTAAGSGDRRVQHIPVERRQSGR